MEYARRQMLAVGKKNIFFSYGSEQVTKSKTCFSLAHPLVVFEMQINFSPAFSIHLGQLATRCTRNSSTQHLPNWCVSGCNDPWRFLYFTANE